MQTSVYDFELRLHPKSTESTPNAVVCSLAKEKNEKKKTYFSY
jgi:hypothetical protein